ncbi:hypothetical protein FGG78_37690, partial [Thioclava sp. BHET1]
MKPNFALNLSHDGIGLFHRTARGWLAVGEVALDARDFTRQMSYLRATAAALDPRGPVVKLVLPESQILYRRVTAPGPETVEREEQI